MGAALKIVQALGDDVLPSSSEMARQAQLTGLGADLGMDVGLGAVARAGGAGDGVLHRVQHDLPVDRFLAGDGVRDCLLYTSPSPRDQRGSRMPSSA